ncbi:MAG: PhnD/SsuA/transferrin family substrate-binding protein [Actinobacteria bacterium]|nr:PhnD/SsuA/transferrin family substrate-binding protein [Actinomycetota bacterium]
MSVPTETDLVDLESIASGEPALLFLCGLPYVRTRDVGLPIEALVAPVSTDYADEAPGYRSLLLGTPGLKGSALEQLTGLQLGINSYDSMSGWVLAAGEGMPLDRFASTTITGAHRRSMELLLEGELDAAPIDSMLLAAEATNTPAFAELPVLARYGPAPSPPVVLAGDDPELAQRLRRELASLHDDPRGRAALALGCMARFDAMHDSDYDWIRECDRRAATCTPS